MQKDAQRPTPGMGQQTPGQGQQAEQPSQQAGSDQPRGGRGQHGRSSGDPSSRGVSNPGQDVRVGSPGGGVSQREGRMPQRFNRDPFSVVQQLSEEMDQLFDSFFYGRPLGTRSGRRDLQTLWAPEIEVRERDNELQICVDLPGVPKENVKVDIEDGALTIQGERSESKEEGGPGQGFHRTERRYGSFYRSIALPDGANVEGAHASMKDGVLEIRLPMAQARQAQRLDIKG